MINITIPKETKNLHFKNEDEVNGDVVGPVWFELKNGDWVNVEDGEKNFSGGYYAKWFTLKELQIFAQKNNLQICMI